MLKSVKFHTFSVDTVIRLEIGDKVRAERAIIGVEVKLTIISDGAVTSTGAGQKCLAIQRVLNYLI